MNKVKLSDVANVNSTIFYINDFNEILYLDTSSVTKNVFDDFIHFSKNDKIPSRAKRAVKDKTIIYSTVRPNLQHFGIFDKPKENIVVSTGFATIDVKNNLADPKFLYYYLTQDKYTNYLHTIATNNVSSYPSINPSDLENLNLEIPKNIEAQSAIARILSSLDDKIELNNKINRELENMAGTIYDYWFVQNASGKWEKKKIGDLIKKHTDNSLRIDARNIFTVGKYPVITQDVGDLVKGYTNEENPIVDLPVIIFGDHSCTLRYVNFHFFRGADGTQLLYFKNEETTIYTYFCLEKLIPNLPNFGKYERHFKYLRDFEIAIPTIEILKKFNKAVSPIFSTIIKNRQESAHLVQLRDFLLPLLMNGQVRVREESTKI